MRILTCISALMTLFGFGSLQVFTYFARVVRYFLISILFLFPIFAQAATYSWTNSVGSFASPTEACLATATNSYPDYSVAVDRISVQGTTAVCYMVVTRNSDGVVSHPVFTASRSGDSCPANTTYNNSTGACDTDNKCAILKGTSIRSFKFKSTTDGPTGTVSKNGCAVTLGVGICVTRTAPLYDCTFSGTVTGDELAIQDGTSTSDCNGDQCHEGEPQKEVKDDPCSAIPTGSGFTCTSSKSEDNPGKSQCGTANGAYVCVDNPKPSSSASITKTEQTSTNNTDGSTTTKTTNTTTTTVCKGIGNCTTGTTTTVVTGGTNSNGTTKPNSSTCTGPECGGGTVTPGNGTGSGNSGDGEGEEGEDEQDTVSGDMSCDAVVACSGDVIQCAILRQDHQSRCADKEFRDLSDKKVADAKASLETEFSQADYQEIKPDADGKFDVSNMLDTSGFLSASCPQLPVLHGSYGSQPFDIDFNFPQFCTFLSVLGLINVAFALKRAATIIGEAA